MAKSLANRLYMQQRLYACKFSEDKNLLDQLDNFIISIDDLQNIGVKLEDEDKAILLNALPKSYENLKDAMIHGRESSITLDEVVSAFKTKETQRSSHSNLSSVEEGLNVKTKFANAKFKRDTAIKKAKPHSRWRDSDNRVNDLSPL